MLPSLGFLDLPREVRDQVYSVMFLSDSPIYPSKSEAGVSDYVSLLRTNKQIYSEVVDIFYGKNTFQIRSSPPWKAPEFLNLLSCQMRRGNQYHSYRSLNQSQVCVARFYLKRLQIPSHGISLDALKHLFSLLKHFPNLEQLRVVYVGIRSLRDMDVVDVCRLLRDRQPRVRDLTLWKRCSYSEAEDISWMVQERPYQNWADLSRQSNIRHMWQNQNGFIRRASVVEAPQQLPKSFE